MRWGEAQFVDKSLEKEKTMALLHLHALYADHGKDIIDLPAEDFV